jgi:hypothetical protein
MKGYLHRGIIKTNGSVDTTESIRDTSKLKVFPSDDAFKLLTSETGNFEWWYFDITDIKTGCMLKLVAHLGTDPLRRKFFPKLAVTVKTPAKNQTIIKPYSLGDFAASTDYCDVKLQNDFHAFADSSGGNTRYHLRVNINEFKADITFISEMEGWKPLGDKVKMERGRREGTFSWIIPVPKAKVTGEFSIGNERYEFIEALGYHDHNYWEVKVNNKLFMDEVITKWYWGRFLTRDYSIIFMNTCLKRHSIRSLMIARENKIIHSSNNQIEVSADDLKKDEEIKTVYPSRITVRAIEEDNPFQMILHAKEVIEKRDLLEGTNPFIAWLIKLCVSRPAYFGILADCTVHLDGIEIKGTAMYELMFFSESF